MKLILSSNVRLGADCAENISVEASHKWQNSRVEKLSELIDKTVQKNASYIILVGYLFGQERVSETVIDGLFRAIHEDDHIQVVAVLYENEYVRISYRNDIPGNFHPVCLNLQASYKDENLAIDVKEMGVDIKCGDSDSYSISINEKQCMISVLGNSHLIPSFEPIGFEDFGGTIGGYAILEWDGKEHIRYMPVEDQKYGFESIEIKIRPEDSPKEIMNKINKQIANYDINTFLRVTLVGRSMFGVSIDGDALSSELQRRIFYVEVFDNTIMDIDEETFENDISLRSEFVKLALQDDSVSESERNRIISCGWNALCGKEVSAE